jgi:hypothetical protein
MGDEADRLIENGMMDFRLEGSFISRQTRIPRDFYGVPKQPRETVKAPENVDDDSFTWWFDETETGTNVNEIASMAWFTAISRFKMKYVPDCLDKYGFNDWFEEHNLEFCAPYEIANLAWMEAVERTLKHLNK